jgi:hypothetical protein
MISCSFSKNALFAGNLRNALSIKYGSPVWGADLSRRELTKPAGGGSTAV